MAGCAARQAGGVQRGGLARRGSCPHLVVRQVAPALLAGLLSAAECAIGAESCSPETVAMSAETRRIRRAIGEARLLWAQSWRLPTLALGGQAQIDPSRTLE
jgi:hypothetical protein